jgi:hypothetical protein
MSETRIEITGNIVVHHPVKVEPTPLRTIDQMPKLDPRGLAA